jgi:hypothetical protein
MDINAQWRKAFARQADADLGTFHLLSSKAGALAPVCHRLHFLQMACEKLVKAYLFDASPVPADALTSHAVILKHLPRILSELYRRHEDRSMPGRLFANIRRVAREIELLAPAVNDAGRRPSNCEYPWLDAASSRVTAPCDIRFSALDLPRDPTLRLILKMLPIAVASLTAES